MERLSYKRNKNYKLKKLKTMDTMENKDRLREKEDKAFDQMRKAGKNIQEARERKEDGSQKSSRLWVWLGVLVLIFI